MRMTQCYRIRCFTPHVLLADGVLGLEYGPDAKRQVVPHVLLADGVLGLDMSRMLR